MIALEDIGRRLEALIGSPATRLEDASELLALGEAVLEHWVVARGLEPTREAREGFRLLALHRRELEERPAVVDLGELVGDHHDADPQRLLQ